MVLQRCLASGRTRRFGRTAPILASRGPGTTAAAGSQATRAFDLVDVEALISDKLFGLWNDLLIVIDEWRVSAPPVVPQLINLP